LKKCRINSRRHCPHSKELIEKVNSCEKQIEISLEQINEKLDKQKKML